MKDMVGRDYQVIEQTQMNDALKQYGYPEGRHSEPGTRDRRSPRTSRRASW